MVVTRTVRAEPLGKIILHPADEAEEILQNVLVILSAERGSIPFNRGCGLSRRFLDRNAEAAQTLMIGEIVEAVHAGEPRAFARSVKFETVEESGRAVAVVEVELDVAN